MCLCELKNYLSYGVSETIFYEHEFCLYGAYYDDHLDDDLLNAYGLQVHHHVADQNERADVLYILNGPYCVYVRLPLHIHVSFFL
ncbi:hypothetical protein VCHA42O253_20136 [Vibrio chagasii]|nr:hypothetical protein VCHA41O249_20132 [Vibrio chagasii]CAH7429864.1 hypothetical protein VCHA42O253_20136 [Vibrio chagasii]